MNPLAVCYLFKDGDEANRCLLYHDQLMVVKDGREHLYPLDHPIDLHFSQKKWMFPFVAGTILFCLSLLFIFRGLFNPWITLTLLMVAAFAIYMGWEGSAFLQIRSGPVNHSFPVKRITLNLKRFASFFQDFQLAKSGQSGKLLIYHIAHVGEWEEQVDQAQYIHASLEVEGFIHCSHRDQVLRTYDKYFRHTEGLVLLAINPLELSAELKLEEAEPNGDLFPHVYGELNREAIVSAKAFQDRTELAGLLT